MSNFAFICPYQLLTFKKKVTFRQLFSRPGPYDPYVYWSAARTSKKSRPYPARAYTTLVVLFNVIVVTLIFLTLLYFVLFVHIWPHFDPFWPPSTRYAPFIHICEHWWNLSLPSVVSKTFLRNHCICIASVQPDGQGLGPCKVQSDADSKLSMCIR